MMAVLKEVLKCVYKKVYEKKFEKPIFKHAKEYLNGGKYQFINGSKIICRINKSNFSLRTLFHIHTNKSSEQNKLDSIAFSHGGGKIIIFDKHCVGHYLTDKGFYFSMTNFEKYYEDFNYPKVKIYGFDSNKKSIEMENLLPIGTFSDFEHDMIIVRSLMKCAISAKKEEQEGVVRYIQHGDARSDNLIWLTDKDFVWIDLDNMRPYPAFLDVFHFFASRYSLREIVEILHKNENLFMDCLQSFGMERDFNRLDDLFVMYIEHYKKINCCFEDIKFLRCDLIESFPRSKKILETINR